MIACYVTSSFTNEKKYFATSKKMTIRAWKRRDFVNFLNGVVKEEELPEKF